MTLHEPENIDELKQIKSTIRMDGWSPYLAFFRGQGSDWPIKPGIVRNDKIPVSEILEKEKNLFNDFISSLDPDFKLQKHSKQGDYEFAQKWINLFQAQHLELKTRLTDWSQDFNHALLFATMDKNEKHSDEKGVVYIYKCPRNLLINFNNDEQLKNLDKDPFGLDKFYLIKHYSQFDDDYFETIGEIRRFRQHGSFLISPSNKILTAIEDVDYIKPHLEKIYISPNLKKEIQENYLAKNLSDYLFDTQNEIKNVKAQRISKKAELLNKKYFSGQNTVGNKSNRCTSL